MCKINHARTLTLLIREFKLLIFLWGHLMILSSLHLFFSTVSPTFISLAAWVIGMLKCFWISSNPKATDLFLPLIFLLSSSSSSSSFTLEELAQTLWTNNMENPFRWWSPLMTLLSRFCPNEAWMPGFSTGFVSI